MRGSDDDDRRGWHRGAAARAVAVLLAALIGAASVAAGAAATEGTADGISRDDLGAEVVVGYGRGPDRDRWSPVEVTLTPRVPIVGTLALRVNGALGTGLRTEAVEVAAGATKVVHLLAPPGEELSVRFTPQGGTALQLNTAGRSGGTDVLVGGLGDPPALPDTLTSLGSDRAVRAVAVDAALLDAGPRVFEALDAVLLTSDALATMSDDQRRSLEVAVAQGLDLVVPVGAGARDLPLRWSPVVDVTPDGDGVSIAPAPGTWSATGDDLGTAGGDRTVVATIAAGDGRVVATAAAPGETGLGSDARLWASVLQPRADSGPPFAGVEHGGFSAGLFGNDLSIPGSVGFALFVLVFVLVVGPVNALALRRWGRRELAWVTVPAITVAFTLVAVGSAAARAPTTSPVVRASWWFDDVGEELTAIAVQSASRGTTTVDLPAGFDGLVAEPWSGLTGSLVRTPDATRIGVPLESLQTASVVAWGPAKTAPLTLAATFADDQLEIEVTSRAESTLTDVEVHIATRVHKLDDVAAGDTVTATIEDLPATLPRPRWADGHGAMMGMDIGRARQPGPRAGVALLQGAILDETPGPVWVTAVLADDPDGTVPGVAGSIEDRGTVVAVGVTPTRTSGDTSPYEVQRQPLRTGPTGWRPGPLLIEGADELLVRFRLPADAAPGSLISTLDAGGAFAGDDDGFGMGMVDDPWSGGCWEVTVTGPDGEPEEPEERCGPDVACPMGSESCGGDDRQVEACWRDGRCQVAVRIGDDTDADFLPDVPVERRAGAGPLAGVEVLDHSTGSFVPASEAFTDGTGDPDRLVSPLGEVLLRVRGGWHVDLGQRGIGVGGTT
ncbi:hypothetical protein [Nitriliruptor alkaliphilus]|uniref:hypothetical protein n=1 Tax=Nitriliruptor alkaliphilus TaxID=427918 RepID=UPI0006972F17|nr:hypothetical protein [Nitriliruptor alkaliphilus]